MVASHHPRSRREPDVRAESDSRGDSGSQGDAGSRPPLRLVVDNTRAPSRITGDSPGHVVVPATGDVRIEAGPTLAGEMGAWLEALAQLGLARSRVVRQRFRNRLGRVGLQGHIRPLVPVMLAVSVILFGGLLGLRLIQESSPVEASAVSSPSEIGAGSPSEFVVVHPGDSLWSIATTRFPDQDPRRVVDALVEANGGSTVSVGQQLAIPAALLDR